MRKIVLIAVAVIAVVAAGIFGYSKYDQGRRQQAVISSSCVSFSFNIFDIMAQSVALNIRNNCGFPITVAYTFAKDKGKYCGDQACLNYIEDNTAARFSITDYGRDKPYNPDGLRMVTCKGNVNCFTGMDQLTRPSDIDRAIQDFYRGTDPSKLP